MIALILVVIAVSAVFALSIAYHPNRTELNHGPTIRYFDQDGNNGKVEGLGVMEPFLSN